MSESTLSVELLKPFREKASTFIETGTGRGEGIQTAIECDFQRIISIEANPDVFHLATTRFIMNDRVECMMGDSGGVLPGVVPSIGGPAVFWLDAHYSNGEPELGPGVNKCPILQDLKAVMKSPIKNHIILVDDIRYFRTGLPLWNGVRLGDIVDVIMQINPAYSIRFKEGFEPQDILVAEVL